MQRKTEHPMPNKKTSTQISARLSTDLVDLMDKEVERLRNDDAWALTKDKSRSYVINLALYWWFKTHPDTPKEVFSTTTASDK